MQALIRTVGSVALFPVKLLRGPAYWIQLFDKALYQAFLRFIWWLYHFAAGLQKVEVSSVENAIDLESLPRVPRVYLSWHARVLGGVPLLELTKEIYCVSMPHNGWGNEGRFQANLRKAFFANMHRKGFRFIEMQRKRRPGETVERMVEVLNQGHSVLMTGDGAHTGAFIAQLGGILAASKSGVELVPYSYSSSRKIRINPFWDNFMVPVPFGTTHLRLGKPMRFGKDMGPEELEAARQALARALNEVTIETDDRAGIRREYRLKSPDSAMRVAARD